MKTRISLSVLLLLSGLSVLAQPRLTSTNPNKGNTGQRLNVSISGTRTHFVQGTRSGVYFTQGTRTVLYPRKHTVVNDTLLRADLDIPTSAPLGKYNVHVYNNIDGSMVLPNSFTVRRARLLSTNPTSAKQGAVLPVTIAGNATHFHQATKTQVYLSQGTNTIIYALTHSATNGSYLNTSFKIPSSAPTGRYDVHVVNEIDGAMSLKQYFSVIDNPNAARIVLVNPDEGSLGKTLNVSISGTKTEFAQGTSTFVYFTQGTQTVLQGAAISVSHDSLLSTQLSIPANANLGDYDVQVVKPGIDYYRKDKGFTVVDKVAPPTVMYLDPDSVIKGRIAQVRLYARGAVFTRSNSAKITLKGRSSIFSPAGVSVMNDTTLSFSVDTRSAGIDTGLYDVTLTHGYYDDPLEISDGLRIVAPVGGDEIASQVLSIYPNPAQHMVTLVHPGFSGNESIKLMDLTSKTVHEAVVLMRQQGSTTLDLSPLPQGSYIVELRTEEGSYSALLFRQ